MPSPLELSDVDPLEWMAPIEEGLEAAEMEAMRATAGRLERGIDTPGWAAAKEAEVATFKHELDRAIRIDYDANAGFVREAFLTSYRSSLVANAGPVSLYATNPRPIVALADELSGRIGSTRGTILRQAEDVYRQAVRAELPGGLVGGLTRRQTTQRILNGFADKGVTGFTDKAGRRWDLASYTEMSVRTGMMNAAIIGSMDAHRANGKDLLIISDAFEECPVCRPWERRVVSISGDPKYPSVDDARAAGVFHGNCRHSMSPYVPGLTRGKDRGKGDERGNKERERQRELERGIRRWKRREAVAIEPNAARFARAKRQQWQGAMKDFIKATGRQRLYYREGGRVVRAITGKAGPKPLGVTRAGGYHHPKAALADELWEKQAEKLAARHGMTVAEYEAAANARYAEILARSDLSTQVDDYTLQLILADGRFKTQFETGTSMGLLSTEARSNAEDFMFGLSRGIAARERPFYGHMYDPEIGSIGDALSYGDVQVVFKASTRQRATITGTDSLEIGEADYAPSVKPSPLTNPSVRSVRVMDAPDTPYLNSDPLAAQRLNEIEISYTEAQIHGGVSVQDIDRVVFTGSGPSPELRKQLEDAGIPWIVDPARGGGY